MNKKNSFSAVCLLIIFATWGIQMSEEISISNEINFSTRNDNFAATSQKKV